MGFKTYFEHVFHFSEFLALGARPDVVGSLAATSGAPVGR